MHIFNAFHYITFRIIAAMVTALLMSLLFGSWFINQASKWFKSKVREHTPEGHKVKNYTPTMGGLFILMTSITSIILWCNLLKSEVWILVACLVGFGSIGLWDDWSKIYYHKGIKEKHKLVAQLIVALIIVLLWLYLVNPTTQLCIPFFKNLTPVLGWFIIPWAVFIIVGTSNAVNLTDGLDGLAIGSLIMNFTTFSVLCYLAGNALTAWYLSIPFAATGEIAVAGSALIGSSIGFLWYNAYPAQIFMGDVGSLALGAGLACMAVMARQELLLPLAAGLFMIETFSVIIQVACFKMFKKRVFKMAPIHHHFELLGWQEAKITTRFTIITLLLCLCALITLKIR